MLDKLACVHKESTIQTQCSTADAAGLLRHSFGLRLTAAKEQMLTGHADIHYTCIPHNKLPDLILKRLLLRLLSVAVLDYGHRIILSRSPHVLFDCSQGAARNDGTVPCACQLPEGGNR